MATPYYIPEDRIPLPPKDADVLTTACDYCVVGCGYKVYRWPVGKEGGPKATPLAWTIPSHQTRANGSVRTCTTWCFTRANPTT
jgi:hypothetical protein